MSGWLTALLSFLLHDLIVLTLIPVVLLRKQDPTVRIAWILAILFMPFLGAAVYLAFGESRMARRARSRRPVKHRQTVPREGIDVQRTEAVPATLRLLERICPFPAVGGNRIQVLSDMRQNYEEQLAAIDAARHFVHVEYYIFQSDAIGERFKNALVAAARRGVRVRFLYDALGSLRLHRSIVRDMRAAGIETGAFIPLNLFTRRWLFNFRNHRKIVVVDGQVAFMGGANIGLEYLGTETSTWGDTHLRLEGPTVLDLERVFAEDWAFATGESLTDPQYFPEPNNAGVLVAQVVPGGPDLKVSVYHELYFSAVASAERQVRITTPYFVPSEPVIMALVTAARRGVDIEILVPARSTHLFVQLAARSYYRELLEAGGRIYEFTAGFMHSKVLTVDGRLSVVGTANFDHRSMRLNFEIGVAMHEPSIAAQLDANFDANKQRAQRILLETWRRRPIFAQVLENVAGLFSPIL